MGNKSFYDLDYIIEINEQRLEQYANAHQKIVERFTTLLVIYSILCIFLVPIIQTLFLAKEQWHWSYYYSFYVFCILFIISIINSIMLLSPEGPSLLLEPATYYLELKTVYETEGFVPPETDAIIKGSYIAELEKAVIEKKFELHRKVSFYNRAFYYAILSCIPYLHCTWTQINPNKKIILKKEIIDNFSSFNKTNHICGKRNKNSKRSMTYW
jgi:hypothetical protein